MQSENILSPYQSFIHISRYSRWLPELKRRETWPETVQRYVDFFVQERGDRDPELVEVMTKEIGSAIEQMKVMPSMRVLMTAGAALRRENVAAFNCSYLAINTKRSFSEALYILLCFHPDTKVVTKRGDVSIKDVVTGDYVRSFDETTSSFKWCLVTSQVKTPSSNKPKVSVVLDNGQTIKCTADHQWLTSNRAWVEAQHLTVEDDLVAPTQSIYKIANKSSGKSYVGMTHRSPEARYAEHVGHAFRGADSHLHKAIRKYGSDAFEITLIDVAYTREEAAEKERFWIGELNTYGATGYNATLGGEGVDGYKWTDEQRQRASENAYERTPDHRRALGERLNRSREKITAALRTPESKAIRRLQNLGENNPQFGKTLSAQRKAEISAGQMGELNQFFGKQHSEESKLKISEAKKGQGLGEANPYFGKKHSEATKAKMRAAWAAKREQKQKQSELEVA